MASPHCIPCTSTQHTVRCRLLSPWHVDEHPALHLVCQLAQLGHVHLVHAQKLEVQGPRLAAYECPQLPHGLHPPPAALQNGQHLQAVMQVMQGGQCTSPQLTLEQQYTLQPAAVHQAGQQGIAQHQLTERQQLQPLCRLLLQDGERVGRQRDGQASAPGACGEALLGRGVYPADCVFERVDPAVRNGDCQRVAQLLQPACLLSRHE
mmetsp:Transcript_16081/g.34780  ORF Transcript_16081/g.34780 Transcript_16081/m.34780 type:complete len:207 (+) Transcript_16081:568-1188(+)